MNKKILEKALAQGFSAAEVFASASKTSGFEIYEGKMDSYQSALRSGLSLRGIIDGRIGYAYTEEKNDAAIDALVVNCLNNGRMLDKKETVEFVAPQPVLQVETYYPEINAVSLEQKKALLIELEKKIRQYDPRITQVQCRYREIENEASIDNTSGLSLKRKSNAAIIVVSVMAKEKESSVMTYEAYVLHDFDSFELDKKAKQAAEKALAKLNPVKIKSGSYRCIIQNETFADLLGALCSIFSLENAQKGLSVLKDKKNQQVFSDKITLIDDPLLKDGYSSCAFDDEGWPSRTKTVVENGVLKMFLNDQKSAGGLEEPSGNGFRGSYSGRITTAPTNFYIQKGNASFEELLQKLDHGVLITDVAGLHAGLNALTANFSLEASGFYVENGKIVKPISLITIAANFIELMNHVEALGEDLIFTSDAIGSPSILFESIAVSGE